MIQYETLNIGDDIKSILKQYDVDFAFQPIFSRFNTVVGHEALMRPKGKSVLEFIEEMKDNDKLHDMELLSFFGATQAYRQRGYDTLLSINSFPSETFSKDEVREYLNCFGEGWEKLIVEILEYTEEKHWTWKEKKSHIEEYQGIEIALDDFGTGNNDEAATDYYNPHMIKIDRSLISDIDKDVNKQSYIKKLIDTMHKRMIVVLAEGIETEAEFNYMRSVGADFFQGYYLGKPA